MKKIVMFDGEIETQQYFTYRMRDEFERLGHEVYTFNLSKTGESLTGLMRFANRGDKMLAVAVKGRFGTGNRKSLLY